MTVLKALKKIFGKSEAEPLAPASKTPSSNTRARTDAQQPGRSAPVPAPAPVNIPDAHPAAEQPPVEKPKIAKPRREAAPKPPVIPWKLEDFAVEPQEGKVRFHDFKLAPELMHAIQDLGFPYCTPIQAGVLGYTLSGRDAIGRAQTGTGKTAAFLISIISQLTQTPPPKERYMGEPRALIIAPTRELVVQIAKDGVALAKYSGLHVSAVYGGTDYQAQMDDLRRGMSDIVVATPGRLLDFLNKGVTSLDACGIMVIDEADRMLDMGFIPDIEKIVSLIPPNRQTLLFSATMPPEIKRLTDKFLSNPKEISVAAPATTASTVEQHLVHAHPKDKKRVLAQIMKQEEPKNAFVFLNRKRDIGDVAKHLKGLGYAAAPLHGDMVQSARTQTLQEFREGKVKFLVCSDVAARGLDISAVSHVFNYDVPMSPDDYVHRIGRTGRAGQSGRAWMIATKEDEKFLSSIERLIKKSIPVVEISVAREPRDEAQNERKPRREEHAPRREERQPRQEERTPRENRNEVSALKPKRPPTPQVRDEDKAESPGFGDDVPAFFR